MPMSKHNANKSSRLKFIIGAFLFLTAIVILIISATQATAEFFMTVRELQEADETLIGQNLRVSGAVIGDTIIYDSATGLLHFTIAHIPGKDQDIEEAGGLEAVLHQAVNDPEAPRLSVVYEGAPPDMLKNEAQAVLTGSLGSDGVFRVDELLLKCPSKYEEALPDQVQE